jgi:ABC-type branched-subunit amino acid transport system ATPase component/ABC-type branched-subunit amino acid transport system permease subunit
VKVLVTAAVTGMAMAGLAFVLPPYDQYVVGRIAVLIVVALGLNLLMGVAGLLSLASAAFMGVGAYVVIILVTTLNVPLAVAVPLAVLVAWTAGWILGTVSLRLSGFYLALVTLGFLLTFQVALRRGGNLTGAGYGLVAPAPDFFGLQLTSQQWSASALFVAGATAILVHSLTRSRIGRAWVTMKFNETAAELCGINLTRSKTSAFAASSALAALAGCLYAYLVGAISPQAFGIPTTVEHLSYIVIGGMGSVLGSVLGPTVLELAPELLRSLGERRALFFGIALLLILVVAPRGLAGLTEIAYRRGLPYLPHLVGRVRVDVVHAGPALNPVGHRGRWKKLSTEENELDFRGVRVVYGGLVALDGLSFSVTPGTLHGLIGPNGAGKTTAINALCGLSSVVAGDISVGGQLLRGHGLRSRRHNLTRWGVARTYQTPLVVPSLSAIENVMVGMHSELRAGILTGAMNIGSVRREEVRARAVANGLLERLGFEGDTSVPASALGFAMLRKVELARALAQAPRLLLLDEPTSGLELHAAQATVRILRELQREADYPLTILIVEHNVPLIFGSCDRVTAMAQGRDLITDRPEVVRHNTEVLDSYLGVHGHIGNSDSAAAH